MIQTSNGDYYTFTKKVKHERHEYLGTTYYHFVEIGIVDDPNDALTYVRSIVQSLNDMGLPHKVETKEKSAIVHYNKRGEE